MEILKGKRPFLEEGGSATDIVLLGAIYKIVGFYLEAYDELEVYLEDPEPYLKIDLTSAAVIARIKKGNSILLVEFETENEGRRVELPAGKVETGVDETIIDTAIREFAEETGGVVSLTNLKPLAVSYHRDGRGGLQFYAEIPEPRVEYRDELGRGYLTPPKGTDNGGVRRLITEPLNVFLDPDQSLLRYSRNPWALEPSVRLTVGLYIKKLDENEKQ